MSAARVARRAAFFAGLAALFPRPALAQDPTDIPPTFVDLPGVRPDVEQAQRRRFWVSGHSRPFIAATLEGTILAFRPQLAVGYGRPHWRWAGIEGFASLAPAGGAEYLGLRAVVPNFDFRAGARYVFPFDRNFLVPQPSYARDEIEYELGPRSRYVTYEAEALGSLPLPTGSLFAVLGGFHLKGVADGFNVYEETARLVMKPPWLWRARAGYFHNLGGDDTLKLGFAGEVLGNPGRDVLVTRAGPVVAVSLTHHLEAVGAAMFVVTSPDNLGFFGTDVGQLGLRYRWATGDRWPEFP